MRIGEKWLFWVGLAHSVAAAVLGHVTAHNRVVDDARNVDDVVGDVLAVEGAARPAGS